MADWRRMPLSASLKCGSRHMGNLLIADTGDNRVRRVDLAGISPPSPLADRRGFSGDGAIRAQIDSRTGVVVDSKGQPLHCRQQQWPHPKSPHRMEVLLALLRPRMLDCVATHCLSAPALDSSGNVYIPGVNIYGGKKDLPPEPRRHHHTLCRQRLSWLRRRWRTRAVGRNGPR